MLQHPGLHQGLAAAPRPRAAPSTKNSHRRPAARRGSARSWARGRALGPPGLGITQPHSLDRRTPKTTARGRRRQDDPTRSSVAACRAGVVVDLRGESRMASDDDDLAGEHPPPGGVGGDQRRRSAGRRRRRWRPPRPPARRPGPLRRPGSSTRPAPTMAGMIRAAPMPSRNDQPIISTAEVRGERRGERAGAVDDQPIENARRRPMMRADLAAGDHQRRHDQRVEGDGGLDAGDGGADVLGDGARSTRSSPSCRASSGTARTPASGGRDPPRS